jgi:hypothetical protein
MYLIMFLSGHHPSKRCLQAVYDYFLYRYAKEKDPYIIFSSALDYQVVYL